MENRNGLYRDQCGLTFIEMLVVVAVSTVILLAITSAILFFYRTNDYTFEQASAIASARKGVEEAVRNIREATYSDEGSYPVVAMADNSFIFYSDIDKDNNIEYVRLFLENGQFKKGVTNATGTPPTYTGQPENIRILSDSVRNSALGTPIFDYYTKEGIPVIDYGDVLTVSFITIALTINVDPQRAPKDFTLKSSATIRNLRPGL